VRETAELVVQAARGSASEVQVDKEMGKVTVRVNHGSTVLADTVRALDAAGIAIGDLSLRKPTLDDVFLTLTGRPAEESGEAEPAATVGTGS
jgi:ABC-2 type transport system ATP-binding protein